MKKYTAILVLIFLQGCITIYHKDPCGELSYTFTLTNIDVEGFSLITNADCSRDIKFNKQTSSVDTELVKNVAEGVVKGMVEGAK